MGRAARPLHDPGNHRSVERGSNPHTARCGSLRRPAKPAGERENDAALTPTPGARPQLWVFGDLVADCAALTAAGLWEFHVPSLWRSIGLCFYDNRSRFTREQARPQRSLEVDPIDREILSRGS